MFKNKLKNTDNCFVDTLHIKYSIKIYTNIVVNFGIGQAADNKKIWFHNKHHISTRRQVMLESKKYDNENCSKEQIRCN